MQTIKTIDLWTEQYDNHYEIFNGAFVDGFEGDSIPFDEYKIIKNCNCKITVSNENINIRNKHNAIVYYNNKQPIRLVVINTDTDVDTCINIALNQSFKDQKLKEIYDKFCIKQSAVDMKEVPIHNKADKSKEMDVGSCDRWNLLYNMLKGSYTESDTIYGSFQNDKYEFVPNLNIKYELNTDVEKFEIEHKCAFVNTLGTRLIPIQENSPLTR